MTFSILGVIWLGSSTLLMLFVESSSWEADAFVTHSLSTTNWEEG
jgi:hypothetical protein